MRLAASLERASEHPLAAAIVAGAAKQNLNNSDVAEFQSITGKGVMGKVEGRQILLGNSSLLDDYNVDPGSLAQTADQLRSDGQTVMFVVIDNVA